MQLRILVAKPISRFGSEACSRKTRTIEMRIFESAAASLVALAAQMLVVATVMI